MKLEDIKTIGVVGGGVMGTGISQCIIGAGYKVIVRDLKDEILAKMKNTITDGRFGMKGTVKLGKMTQEQMEKAITNLSTTTKVEDLKDCDLIIEAIGGSNEDELENKPMKLKVYAELDGVIKKEAIFGSNTTSFTIAGLAAATNRKDRFIGTHFFSPAQIMKAVEVICTQDVREDVVQTIIEFVRKIGKLPCRMKDMPGDKSFASNHVVAAARAEARRLVDEGIVTAEDLNTVMMNGWGWPVGPLPTGARPGYRTGFQ